MLEGMLILSPLISFTGRCSGRTSKPRTAKSINHLILLLTAPCWSDAEQQLCWSTGRVHSKVRSPDLLTWNV
ncbi:hypothetical protein SKAU_G00205340 [Synaphobranchus kaupii]|uniref:Uncharacterized protein n=1 Tax=Synaphobranchus kaupii TaxID=118154 RepID=A0A9Q1FGN5_SYNKA|nr:hypothetical protein SKAU_G00205340 [Synaphobranchus kaupii]